MRVRFWGTRGSLPKPGPHTVRYGGNTSCVEVETSTGSRVIIDCGTGLHDLGQTLMAAGPQTLKGHILISHTHWDHVQGIPFFAPFFVSGSEWDIYAPRGFGQSLRETLAGQMQYVHFPVGLDDMGADIRFHELVEGAFSIDDIHISAHYMNHTALTLGYRLEADRTVVVYACDHEPFSRSLADGLGDIQGQDRAHTDFLKGADLVIHDAQYLATEYDKKLGWGHSTVEYASAMCRAAGVRRLALTHHDPDRTDAQIDEIVAAANAPSAANSPPLEITAAAEGAILDITPEPGLRTGRESGALNQKLPPATATPTLLMHVANRDIARIVQQAAQDDGIRLTEIDSLDRPTLEKFTDDRSLVIFEHAPGRLEPVRHAARMIDAFGGAIELLVITELGGEAELRGIGIKDLLVQPFSPAYVRTRLRASLLRCSCRWERAMTPPDEDERLAALRSLSVLDTNAEERFDRVTRLAAASLSTPIALVSLVDCERQWFKSAFGLEARETSRESSFCAHAVASGDPLIVPDTLKDPRFSDNPLVTGPPHIRFYAGYPIFVHQHCVGTLCVIDDRPREIGRDEQTILRELAGLTEAELVRTS